MTDLLLGGSDPPPRMTDLLLGGSDPPPSMTDLLLGGSDPPPSMTDLALGAGGGGEVRAKNFYAPSALQIPRPNDDRHVAGGHRNPVTH